MRCSAVMQRERQPLVLEVKSGILPGEGGKRLAQRGDGVGRHDLDAAVGAPPLQAVNAGGGQAQGPEDAIEVVDLPAAQQRQRPAARLAQRLQRSEQSGSGTNRVGGRGKFEQRSIDIEEEREIGSRERRGRGHRPVNHGKHAAIPRHVGNACLPVR